MKKGNLLCVAKFQSGEERVSHNALSLGANYNVSMVRVCMGGEITGKESVTVRYAQNGITSDLIVFEGKIEQVAEVIEVTVDTPVAASHIYTTLVAGSGYIAQVEVYEQQTTTYELQEREVIVADQGNIAFQKPVHASSGKQLAKYVTDGSKKTVWQGEYYPAYVDIDLEENFYLDKVEVYTPEEGVSEYSVYTSMNGRDFARVTTPSQMGGREARIIRVYIEYNSASATPTLQLVRAIGTESGTEIQRRPKIAVQDFKDSEYGVAVTAQDTYDEVFGIVERRIGEEYKSWFALELAENPISGHTYDYFELTNAFGKIHVKGNSGVTLATGINHYLKYYCNVSISQVGDQVTMPKQMEVLKKPVFKETKARVRYSYNYCTLSYSMPFWSEREWRQELDWLALNGVNVVLDATAQEEVWRRFLERLGYQHEDIKDYIAGPAYYAWAYMANLSGFGGPVHDSWFEERTKLARGNQLIMRKLGMQPVLQGYSGMVPSDIKNYDKYADVIEQGTWCSFKRPDMLKTTSHTFSKYAKMFYQSQKEVYGEASHYYATDPFHEGGNTGGMSARSIAKRVLTSMLESDPEAVWVIQSWQKNPTSELLAGLEEVTDGKEHAMVLDLYAEKTPHYHEGSSTNEAYGYKKEFNETPWVFCMLNNFGGRLGLHGHLDRLAEGIPQAFRVGKHIAGVGMTPEASMNNPVLYDFLFETIWQDSAEQPLPVNELESWLNAYATRRYGRQSDAAQKAWQILKETVYKAEFNQLGQGAPESVVNARPALQIRAASTWGNAVIGYEGSRLEEAALLLLKDYELLKNSAGYIYDVVTILQQVLSNRAWEYHEKMAAAFREREAETFAKYAKLFLAVIDDMEIVTGSNIYYLLGRWVEQAKALAEKTDDFTKRLYEFNAKALVTTWGSYNQSEIGKLHDYSNRQWAGLIGDFYRTRWERWIDERVRELNNQSYEESIDWFAWEWSWVRQDTVYTTTSTEPDLYALGKRLLKNSQ